MKSEKDPKTKKYVTWNPNEESLDEFIDSATLADYKYLLTALRGKMQIILACTDKDVTLEMFLHFSELKFACKGTTLDIGEYCGFERN